MKTFPKKSVSFLFQIPNFFQKATSLIFNFKMSLKIKTSKLKQNFNFFIVK